MYGHIHVILKDLVLSIASPDAWQKILSEAGVANEALILDAIAQQDRTTLSLVGATCKVLNLPLDSALRAFGNHFVKFALASGNGPFLKSQGPTLHVFLEKVNSIHNYLERDHPNARFPFIESTYCPEEDTLFLTYFSVRQGLMPLLLGVVEEVGARLYGLLVDFRPAEVPEELREAAADNRAAAWHVSWRNRPGGCKEDEPAEVPEPAPAPKKMSFVAWHNAFAGFVRLLAAGPGGCTAPPCCSAEVQTIEVVSAADRGTPSLDMQNDASKKVVGSATDESKTFFAMHSIPSDTTKFPSEDEDLDDSDDEPSMVRLSSTYKQLQVENRGEQPLEDVLLRSTMARNVAASWSDTHLPQCRSFWSESQGRAEDYDLSQDASSVDVFVSHSWSPPENWKIVMGPDVNYADVKSASVAIMAKDIALMRHELASWKKVTVWVDKACIPQDHSGLKESCIGLLENFIRRSDHVCVLFTWSYMDRLWCVFEWACMLRDKPLDRLWLQTESFMTEQTMPLYLECIRYFSIRRCKCLLETDREILTKKIDDTYKTREAFEHLVKATAVALVARSMAFRAGHSVALHKIFYSPWVGLAEEMGFVELAAALGSCNATEWRRASSLDKTLSGEHPVLYGRHTAVTGVSATEYHGHINKWFNSKVAPILDIIRREAVL